MAVDEDKAERVPRPVRRRPRRHHGGRQRGRRAPAGALPGAGRGPGDARRAGRAHRHRHPRYVTEWLRGQAAGGYVTYDAGDARRYSLTEEQAFALDRPGRPGLPARRVPARAGRAARPSRGSPRRSAPAAGSAGTSTTTTCSSAASGSSGPATSPTSSPSWIPALDGVEAKLAGRRRGSPTSAAGSARRRVLLAQAYPAVADRRLRLPRRLDRAGPQARRRRRASPTGSSFEVASAPDVRGHAATTW